jgi:hypothetical protein
MNHYELLAEIDSADEYNYFGGKQISSAFGPALRAVVELHKPSEYEPSQCWACSAYANNEYEADYPCWTIQAIEKELL